jgi:hypothetical protein
MRTLFITLALISAVGCSRERTPMKEKDVALHPTLSDATQADLAREIDDAERRGTWREVKQRWQGQRMTWTVTRQQILCRSASSCNVAAFPIQRPAQHGWLPALDLSPTEFAKLEAQCGNAEQCELTFEGTLADLRLSPELPTNLKFSDVRVIRAHKS